MRSTAAMNLFTQSASDLNPLRALSALESRVRFRTRPYHPLICGRMEGFVRKNTALGK